MVTESSSRRTPALVQVIANAQHAFSDAFNLTGTEVRDNGPPLPDGGGGQPERPRDIRGCLKVIDNVLFQHDPPFTTVKERLQPKCQVKGLTSVAMDKLPTIAERLIDAMRVRDGRDPVSASDLARACGVSPAAVHKWQNGGKLSADNLAAASRALGVREEWLRTGRLPRERENAAEEDGVDRVLDILEDLRGPLSALAAAIDQLTKARPEASKKRHRA
jgi:transcriptional regulator with XRE-family HTH domain